MHTIQELPQTFANTTEIVAGVNEKRLFSSMKHWFATSFSLLGELMQNARRAGATQVAFDFDPQAKTLVVADDGRGVTDFGSLISLADSGWDQQTMLTDKPFGMGFFSVFFACQEVEVHSNGKMITACLEDIASKKLISIKHSAVAVGTRIILKNLSNELLELYKFMRPATYKLSLSLRAYAIGFEIPVLLNGEMLPRPLALSNLEFVLTPLGAIHDASLHARAVPWAPSGYDSRKVAYFLQGLPINGQDSDARVVIHLDSTKFTPLMPDRSRLYNGDEQLKAVSQEHRRVAVEAIYKAKKSMPADAFVRKFWGHSLDFKCMEVFNDVPCIPCSAVQTVATLDYYSDQPYERCEDIDGRDLIYIDEINKQSLRIFDGLTWGPDLDDTKAGVVAKLVQRNKWFSLDAPLDADHWLYELLIDSSELDVEITAGEILGEDDVPVANYDVHIKLVDQFEVTLKSRRENGFSHHETVSDDWLAYREEDGAKAVCLVCKGDKSRDQAFEYFTDFRDEEEFDEAWRDNVAFTWASVLAGLLGSSLQEIVDSHLHQMGVKLQDVHAGQMMVVYGTRPWSEYAGCHSSTRLASLDLESPDKWETMMQRLKTSDALHMDGAALRQVFVDAFGIVPLEEKPVSQG